MRYGGASPEAPLPKLRHGTVLANHALHHPVTIHEAVLQCHPDMAHNQYGNDNSAAIMYGVREKSQRFVLADQYRQIKESKKLTR